MAISPILTASPLLESLKPFTERFLCLSMTSAIFSRTEHTLTPSTSSLDMPENRGSLAPGNFL